MYNKFMVKDLYLGAFLEKMPPDPQKTFLLAGCVIVNIKCLRN